jgi:hypothetical protein
MYWGKSGEAAARKQLAGYLQQSYAISERRASQLVRISRKALHYQAMPPAYDAALIARLMALGKRYRAMAICCCTACFELRVWCR